jgi:tRNA threonylcarbamoyladenosine biosynthesis protein TsaB
MAQRLLIIETSHQPGWVAVADGDRLLADRKLDQARRHARDLAPAMKSLLDEQGWRPRALEGVIVSRGPGSYTGLRVGLMSAKTLAYALDCRLLAIDTFAAIARQAPPEALVIDVIADAQQDKLYVQRFGRCAGSDAWQPLAPLAIVSAEEWRAEGPRIAARGLPDDHWVTGPGLKTQCSQLPANVRVVPDADWYAHADSVLAVGWERWQRGEGDDPFTVEPLYLRPSLAEEKLQTRY